jgi:hypothetical protein
MAQMLPPGKGYTTKTGSRRLGCVLFLVAGLLLLGAGGYLLAGFFGAHLPGFASFGAQPPITTTPLQITTTYRGADITLATVQQSDSFKDDPNTVSDGMVRLKLLASNATTTSIAWDYSSAASLLLPGKSVVAAVYGKFPVYLAPGKSQTNTLDFPVPSSDAISQLALRLGTASEAQIDLPLKQNATASGFQPKNSTLNGALLYFGLNYTLKSASTGLSIPGQQAARGMQFLTLTISVDNTLSQEAIPGSPFDYARLKAGNSAISPLSSTLPVSFETGAAGVTGTITFLVSQNSTTYSLIFLPPQHDSGDQASTDFTLA